MNQWLLIIALGIVLFFSGLYIGKQNKEIEYITIKEEVNEKIEDIKENVRIEVVTYPDDVKRNWLRECCTAAG